MKCTGTDVEICLVSDVQSRLENSSATATGADDCHAPEWNVRNDEMSTWIWIDVGLVIIGDIGWLTANLVTDRRRRRKGQRRTKSASAR